MLTHPTTRGINQQTDQKVNNKKLESSRAGEQIPAMFKQTQLPRPTDQKKGKVRPCCGLTLKNSSPLLGRQAKQRHIFQWPNNKAHNVSWEL